MNSETPRRWPVGLALAAVALVLPMVLVGALLLAGLSFFATSAATAAQTCPAGETTSPFGDTPDGVLVSGAMPGRYPLGPVKPATQAFANLVGSAFAVSTIYGYRQDSLPDHPSGLAVDLMVGTDTARGDRVAGYVKQHAAALGVKYLIWQQRIWNTVRAGEGWRAMADRGSPTANHRDHVHVTLLPDAPRLTALPTGADASPASATSSARVGDGEGFGLPPPGSPRQNSLRTPPLPIPPAIQAEYQRAADRYRLPWALLAGIGMEETGHGRTTAVSSAGAQGPMQFMPATWATYGVDGDGDGRTEVTNPVDAIAGAANYLTALGAHDGPDGLRQAIFGYNHADWYVNDVLWYAAQYGGGAVLSATPQDATCAPLAAGVPGPGVEAGPGGWVLPLRQGSYSRSSGFGPRVSPGGVGSTNHQGVDFAAAAGTPILTAADGTVTAAGPRGGYGNLVEIAHGGEVTTRYGHQSRIAVRVGQPVTRGQVVGYVGSTGASTGNHLHFEVRVHGTPVDPVPYLKGKGLNP